MSSRMRPVGAIALTVATLGLAGTVPANADTTTSYGGFATDASATPLRLEVHEPAIPVPADPEVELNFSYTHVAASSGPASTARASAMWPGAPVGEGLKTIVDQMGLPPQLGAGGYPAQVNAQHPGTPSSQSQEFLPGMVGRASAGDEETVARAGYSTSGTVAGDDASSGSDTTDLLDSLKNGDLSALGDLLGGSTDADPTAPANPLGALSMLVSVGGMSSSSRTRFGADSVSATSTSQVGDIALLGGLVELDGVTVTSTSTSRVSGATTKPEVSYGGLRIAGTEFELTSDGIEAAGNKTAIPGLPDAPVEALARLGISITTPEPAKSVKGSLAASSATGPTISIDATPLTKLLMLDKLPLADLVNQFPDSAGQLKGLLLAALQAHPRTVLVLGEASSRAQAIPAVDVGGTNAATPTGPASTTPSTAQTGTSPSAAAGGSGAAPDAGTPAASAGGPVAPASAPLQTTSAEPGLPPLGSVPGMLVLGGMALAVLTGWWLRRGLAAVFGGAGSCPHGLQSGLPDLRKV